VEIFRHAVADRFVLLLANRSDFKEGDFHPEEGGGLYLNKEALKHYFECYEQWMMAKTEETGSLSFRDRLRAEVRGLAAAVREGVEWRPGFGFGESAGGGEKPCDTSSVTI
jgi:CRISPR/Cas system-associated endonuclease Cas1